MVESGTVGETLRRLRIASGHSLSAFAEIIRYDKGYLSRIETGQRRPSLAVLQRADAALKTGGTLVAHIGHPGRAARRLPKQRPPADVAAPTSTGRAGLPELVDRLAARGIARRGGSIEVAPDRASHGRLAATAQTLSQDLRALCQQVNATTCAGLVEPWALTLAASVAGCPDETCELLEPAFAYADLAGWMAQESSSEAVDDWIKLSAVLAGCLGSADAVAHTWIRQAETALYRCDAAQVLSDAGSARAAAGPGAGVLVSRITAQGAACAGDHDAYAVAIDQMRATTDRPVVIGRFQLGSTSITDLLGATIGWCEVDLHRPDQAIQFLEKTVATLAPASVRMRGLFAARLSTAYARIGERRQAVEVGRQAVAHARRTGSGMTRVQLRAVSHELRRWRRDSLVQQFLAEAAALT
ncbi:helix-turn-helix domain-containing protein [Micromonospora sp. SD19]